MLRKLLKLKEWLTVPDAARHLSIMFDEEVTEADVLRLGLDKHLTLSVNFVNGVRARCGPLLSREAASQIFEGVDNTKVEVTRGKEILDGKFWQESNDLTYIHGIWDLLMISNEIDDVHHAYQTLTGGPAVEATSHEGAFVVREGQTACRLQANFYDNEFASKHILKLPRTHPSNYYPGCLPSDAVFVVRTSALRELEARVSELDKPPEKSLGQRERTTLLVMIAALAKLARIDVSKPSSAAAAIESQTALMGARVAARTIENHLNSVPQALESRQEG